MPSSADDYDDDDDEDEEDSVVEKTPCIYTGPTFSFCLFHV